MQQLIELRRLDAHHCSLLVDELLLDEIRRDLDRRRRRALAVAGLQHVERTVLNRELEILHVAVMALKLDADRVELLEDLGHDLLQRRILRLAHRLGDRTRLGPLARTLDRDLLRRTDTRHHIFALRIDQVFAVEILVLASRRIAGEGDAGCRVVAGVAEHHRLHVHRRTQQAADIVQLAVLDGARVVPRPEDRTYAERKLLHRVSREIAPLGLLDHLAVAGHHLLQVFRHQLRVQLISLGALHRFQLKLELVVVNTQHHVAEHLDEAAIGVPHETGIVGAGDHRLDRIGIQAEVQNGVHHTGHRGRGTGAHRDQQRIRAFAERLARRLFQTLERGLHLSADQIVQRLLADLIVLGARFRRDGKSWGNWQAESGHVGKVCALAPEQRPHRDIALRLIRTKEIDVLRPLRFRRRLSLCRGSLFHSFLHRFPHRFCTHNFTSSVSNAGKYSKALP